MSPMRTLALMASLASSAALAAGPKAAVEEDVAAPNISHTPVKTARRGQPLTITAEVYDDSEVEVTLYFRKFGEGMDKAHRAQMLQVGDKYQAVVPGIAVMEDLEYFLEAFDVNGNGPTRHGSDKKPHQVKVTDELAPPPPPVAAKVISAAPAGEAPAAAVPVPAPVEPPPPPEVSGPPREDMPMILGALGGGGAGLLAGTIFLVMATSAEDEVQAGGKDRKALDELLAQSATRRTLSLASFTVGILAAGAGAALYFLGAPAAAAPATPPPPVPVSVAPSAPGAEVGASVSVMF